MDDGPGLLAERRRGHPVNGRVFMDGGRPVALVTGAGGGLGRAIVARFAAEGWRVAASTRREGEYAADVADSSAVTAVVERVVADHGRLDLVVSNAAELGMAAVAEHPLENWWRIVRVNLSGGFFLARAAAPHLRRTGGSIVFVSSEWGVTGYPRASAYAAGKAGLIGLTRALARELAPSVRVNALAPGAIDTPQLAVDAADAGVSLDELKARYAAAAPLGRIATPEEIAGSVFFLTSDDARYYTGQVLQPNGGTTTA